MVITYYPWSNKVLGELLAAHDEGELSSLDLDLTAKCTYASCIYCDSKPGVGQRHRNELNTREKLRLLQDAKRLGIQWVFSCGLGEPLEDTGFEPLIERASELGVRFSIFTNGIGIDRNRASWLHQHSVGLILKLDTFDEATFDTILGRKGAAQKIYNALDLLLEAGYGGEHEEGPGYTNLALSIVPTSLTYREKGRVNHLDEVITFAKEHGIFPSVGELEQAGRALEQGSYEELAIRPGDLQHLRSRVEELLWKDYTRPICPTIVTGVHIDNVGNCVADRETGLNCKWFLLEEPLTRIMGNVRQDSLATLFSRVRQYRKDCFRGNGNGVRHCESVEYVFGGCGGSPSSIIDLARKHL